MRDAVDVRADGSASVRAAKRSAILERTPKLSLGIVLLTVAVGLFAPWIAPHDPVAPNLAVRELPPAFLEGGSRSYPLGTDRQGRDILTRVIYGARVSLSVSVLTLISGGLVGLVLGLVAGYHGRWVDALVMGAVDVSLAFPFVLLALVLAASGGSSFSAVVTIVALMVWGRYARLVRGEVLSLKQRDFVALARVAGCSSRRVLLSHIVPNLVNSVVVLSTLQVGWAIVTEGFLSFLGAGVPPPEPSWGGMVAEGRNYIDTLWWIAVFPGLAIMLVVLAFNLVGDWLRDVLDPKLRQL
jgi:peptide/nickel transport system permease protein